MSATRLGSYFGRYTRARRTLSSKIVGQAVIYMVAGGAATGLSGISKAILARGMSASAFGSFSFAVSLMGLVASVPDFGVFTSAARRLAKSDRDGRGPLLGALFVTFVPLAAMTSAAAIGLSFVVDQPFHVHASTALRVGSIFAWAWVFALFGELVAKGADRLHVFSISNLVGRLVLVAALGGFLAAGTRYSVTFAYMITTVSMALSMILLILWLRPQFRRVREHVLEFVADCKAWAFQAYVGRLFSVGTYNMDVLMVAAFSNAKSTGYYALASALAGVMGIPLLGLSAALFPKMAAEDEIDRRWLAVAWGVGALGVLAVVLLVQPLVGLVFSKKYDPVAPLAIPLVIATGVRGVTTVYNTYLSAHAGGREMRNTSIILTMSNLAFNFALIPPFGATGAAWASLIALMFNYAGYVYYYRRHVAQLRAAR